MIRKNDFIQLIAEGDFKQLFITELGWNQFRAQSVLPTITIDDRDYCFTTIAERNGFQILTCNVEDIPNNSTCRKLDAKLRRQANDYICIYQLAKSQHHLWVVPVKTNEKRELTFVEYENAQKADLLYSKVEGFSFELDEVTTIVDLREKVQGAFAVNSEKITKDFYSGFRKEHKAFINYISGMDDDLPIKDNRNKEWYTSVMLNRLMFCYFVQKKGFLNNDHNYLSNKLKWIKQQQGEGRYYSFYRDFLRHLFSDGLNLPKHTREWEQTFGKIPYLNGGMFDEHQLEREYPDIDIEDEAFERLFAFFDTWNWHLDTRITASGKDINPDVLGYIFEQYINDRAAMGAYYTKEDITDYIGKSCILPFLMDRLKETDPAAFKPEGEVWTMLKQSGDRYIYDAVKYGYSVDWRNRIPNEISIGLDTKKPNLLERRKQWNAPTPEPWALPTEIWRETVARLQRCDMLLTKIQSGEITAINDFITYNLDIRSFVYDLLSGTNNHKLVLHFYHALQQVTILDPTCGSGAFLFAAMNILEPLYEICIERMQEWNEKNPNLFKTELDEISNKYRSNIQYFIYKSIILRNLYGVDIMVEATEIAKLRLFLKMVAVVEVDRSAPNMGLDPLPDIDFNVRCGNTLVGYATEKQLIDDLNRDTDILQMVANQEFKEKLDNELANVATTYEIFKSVQFYQETDMKTFKTAKMDLKKRLASLNELLNKRLFGACGYGEYEDWLSSHQPFHWMAEFYQIMHGNGGFDVIIGNPPYLELRQISYTINSLKTLESSAIHAMCIERSLQICKSSISMIVPIALVCTQRMIPCQKLLEENHSVWYSNFAWRPAHLFDNVSRALTIFIAHKSKNNSCFTTSYLKWTADVRKYLFKRVFYIEYNSKRDSFWMPKFQSTIEIDILNKVFQSGTSISSFASRSFNHPVYYRTTGGVYWKTITNWSPRFTCNGVPMKSSRETTINFKTQKIANIVAGTLSSGLYWWWYTITSNLRDLNPSDISGFFINSTVLQDDLLENLSKKYMKDLEDHSVMQIRMQKTKGETCTQLFKVKQSKPIIDEIDKVLAKHYGFSEEELDFILNYDIKYRMGEELNNDE